MVFTILAIALLSGCDEAAEPDCDAVREEIFECMDWIGERPIMGDLDDCIPMQQPETIEGTWAQGFEFNQFYEGRRLTFDEAFQFPETTTSVWPQEGIEAVGDPEANSVVYVSFEGRRPVCDASDDHRDIWMDRVIASEVIEERPSAWYE